jgi:hypothetical protein
MKYTNKHSLPDPVVRALTSYEKGEKVEGLRVTTLIDSPRVSQLRQSHAADITEDVSDMVWKVMGTAIHEVFEKAASNAYVSEERLSHTVDGTVISGAIDYQFESDGEIDLKDYKSTSVFSVLMGDKPEWEKQINTYAYLIRHAKKLKVRSASVVAVLRDWRKSDAERRGDYPPAPITEIKIRLWPDDEQDAYVKERVRLHRVAELEKDFDLPACTPEEQWAKPAKWAVYKGKSKRALKLFESQNEAQVFVGQSEDRSVVERPATLTRCENNYCRVADFCDQWR